MAYSSKLRNLLAIVLIVPAVASASGSTAPDSAELSYSFSCPSGLSGHFDYKSSRSPEASSSRFVLQVRDKAFQDDPRIVSALSGKRITAVEATCSPGLTHLIISTWQVEDQVAGTVTIGIETNGQVSFVEA